MKFPSAFVFVDLTSDAVDMVALTIEGATSK
jgi:hypothetical protein